jgi:hypothetical protein
LILAVSLPLFTVWNPIFCSVIGFAVKAVALFQYANAWKDFFISHNPCFRDGTRIGNPANSQLLDGGITES